MIVSVVRIDDPHFKVVGLDEDQYRVRPGRGYSYGSL